MTELIVSVDFSLRSSGVVVLDKADDAIVHFEVIKTDVKQFPDDEATMIYIKDRVSSVMLRHPKATQFVIEKVALGAKSPKKDVIAGAYWAIRTLVYKYFPSVLIGTVTVNTWRNWYTTKEERELAKRFCADDLKNVVFTKHPDSIQKEFLLYVEDCGWDLKTVYDLSDAYGLALYRNSLDR